MDNEFLLQDRIQKIQQIITRYGENKFYISFSGGKDSTVLHELIDMALPGNTIPRVFADTGIELNMVKDFVIEKSINDNRFFIIKPRTPIKTMLEEYGYPFKSKKHAQMVKLYQRFKTIQGHKGLQHYLHVSDDGVEWKSGNSCPKILKYQFTPEFNIKISDMCCVKLKEEPLAIWAKENKTPINIAGLMRSEGGRRSNARCLSIHGGKILSFHPLAPMNKEWENWFIDTYNIDVCDIYKPPYNFVRTGCKGCPFAKNIQEELVTLDKYFPNERKQCELIWKPVYDEYRRIGYRLK